MRIIRLNAPTAGLIAATIALAGFALALAYVIGG